MAVVAVRHAPRGGRRGHRGGLGSVWAGRRERGGREEVRRVGTANRAIPIPTEALAHVWREGEEKDVVNMEVLNWVLEGMNSHEGRVVLNDDFEKSEFFRKINQSSLPFWNKLFLTNLVGEWSDYEDLVRPTIESVELADNEEEKNKIKSVLYDVL